MRRLLLFLSILQLVQCSCPSGFELVKDECRGNYTSVATYWDEFLTTAVEKCNEVLGQPIIIHNADDQKYWGNRVSSAYYSPIGLTCNTSSKLWEWVDGSPLDYKPPSGNYNTALDSNCDAAKCNWGIYQYSPDGYWACSYGQSAYTTDIFCTTPLRQSIPSTDGCESFDDDSEDGVCYQVGATAENWQDAQLICNKLGANLASIHNLQENSFLRRLAVSKGAVNGVFLGATLSGKGKDFGWIDGSAWDYDNFYPGFPLPGIGNCLAMDTTNSAGQWMNIDCSAKLPVACVRAPKNNTESTCNAGFSEEGKLITSPGFPYSASMPCDYFLDVEEGKSVEVEIVFLEANPCCDYLVIHDGYLGGSMIANLTGEIRNATYTSTSNLMRVSWQPNGGENVRGMAITYRGA